MSEEEKKERGGEITRSQAELDLGKKSEALKTKRKWFHHYTVRNKGTC